MDFNYHLPPLKHRAYIFTTDFKPISTPPEYSLLLENLGVVCERLRSATDAENLLPFLFIVPDTEGRLWEMERVKTVAPHIGERTSWVWLFESLAESASVILEVDCSGYHRSTLDAVRNFLASKGI